MSETSEQTSTAALIPFPDSADRHLRRALRQLDAALAEQRAAIAAFRAEIGALNAAVAGLAGSAGALETALGGAAAEVEKARAASAELAVTAERMERLARHRRGPAAWASLPSCGMPPCATGLPRCSIG